MNNFSPNTSLPESPTSEHPSFGFNFTRDQSTFGTQDTGKYEVKFISI